MSISTADCNSMVALRKNKVKESYNKRLRKIVIEEVRMKDEKVKE